MQGLILDVRFNPGGRLDQAKAVVNLFIRKGVIVRTKGLHRAEDIATASPDKALSRDFPMIVLVNEHSASAAEIVAGSLKDNQRALIVGTRTYGKGSVQEIIPMQEDGGELKMTVAYYYLPSGRLVHRKKGATDWGVDPQISIPMSEEGEQKVLLEQGQHELFHKPLPLATRPTTGPASTQAATLPATQPVVDIQLQQALSTLVGSIILNGQREAPNVPETQPTTAPVAHQ
jgi:carboxyl-terminal processing protease